LHLCPALRNKGADLVAVVSNQESRLAKACDMKVFLPVDKELCPMDPQSRKFLEEQMDKFFFGSGSALPPDYRPRVNPS